MSKNLKDCLLEAVEIIRSVEETAAIRFPDLSSTAVKLAISIYIQESNGKNGKANFTGFKGNGDTVINFGKHKGQSLKEILKDDKSYLRWLSDKAKDPTLKAEAEKLLKEKPSFNNNVIIPEVGN